MAQRCYTTHPPHLPPPSPPKVLDHTFNGGRLRRIVDDSKDKNMTYNEKIAGWLKNIPEFVPVNISAGEFTELAPSFSKEDRLEGSLSHRGSELVLSRSKGDGAGGSSKDLDDGNNLFRLQGTRYMEFYSRKMAQTSSRNTTVISAPSYGSISSKPRNQACQETHSSKVQPERESRRIAAGKYVDHPRYKNTRQTSTKNTIITSSPTDTTLSLSPNQPSAEDKCTNNGICRNKNAFGDTPWWSPGAKVRASPPPRSTLASQGQEKSSTTTKKSPEKSRQSLHSGRGDSSHYNTPRWR